jgi:16S rRNA (guanine1516-N2)-methyltransferase
MPGRFVEIPMQACGLRLAVHAETVTNAGVCDPADSNCKDESQIKQRAESLAQTLKLPFLDHRVADESKKTLAAELDVLLVVTSSRLELRMIGGDPITQGGKAVFCDLTQINLKDPASTRYKQPIAKAVGLKPGQSKPVVADATAGWGEDSWLLAALGCEVIAIERDAIIVALLRDGLSRAGIQHDQIASRITVLQDDALARLLNWQSVSGTNLETSSGTNKTAGLPQPDVVYLDPMFPPKRKGAEAKPMRVLRQLVGADLDADDLLPAARQLAKKRVVVKRPLHGVFLNDEQPVVTHKGKSLRYDVYT